MNPEVITISINQDERIVGLLNRMLELKKENNQEVEGIIADGLVLTTKDCNTLEEALVANSDVIFRNLENERNEALNNDMLELVSANFKNRGMKSNPIDTIQPEIIADTITKENEFKTKIKELDSLNYSDPIEVHTWLTNLIKYVNNPNLSLYLDNNENFVTKIVDKFKENNYTNKVDSVTNMNDYYKKLVSYQLDELEKYNFFAYEKMVERIEDKKREEEFESNIADKINEPTEKDEMVISNETPNEPEIQEKEEIINESSEVNMDNQNIPTNNVEQLLAQKEILEKRLEIIQQIKNGELVNINGSLQKSQSFTQRKEAIEQQINQIKKQQETRQNKPMVESLTASKAELEEILRRPGRVSREEETTVLQQYYTVVNHPSDNKENFNTTIEAVQALPETSEIKSILLDVLEKTKAQTLTEEDIKKEEQTNLNNSILASKAELEEILRRPGRVSREEETTVLQQYYTVVNHPSDNKENFNTTIEAVQALPETSEIKPILLDVLEKTKAQTFTEEDIKKEEQTNLNNNILASKAELEEILRRPGRVSREEETAVLQQYYTVVNHPSDNMMEIIPLLNKVESLPETSEIKPLLITVLGNTLDKTVDNLQQQYAKVEKEEQDAKNHAENLEKQTKEKLEGINKEIEEQQALVNSQSTVENDEVAVDETTELGVPVPEEPVVDNNRPISHIAPLDKPLEDDYYQRLENAAKEGPIFHDTGINYDLTPQQEKKKFSIKSIKKAPAELIKKVKDSKFTKKVAEVTEWFKQHKLATAVITGGVIVAAAMMSGSTANSSQLPEEENAIEQTMDNTDEKVEQEVAVDEVVEEKTEEQQFEESLQNTLNDILGTNTKVYTSVDRAINDEDAKTPYVESWKNANANTFYDSEADVIGRDEAEKIIADGGEVVARFDNDGTIIGYAKVSQELSEDASGKSM